ncbi:g8028 [Coccomyxa viridis]|uniref:Electron transfer flavoprotein subunit alpha n=1 Tax=Coccomyxa viridis TaxID=1274662 RepID=A0ABP1G1U9_9CHLO
MLAQWRLLHLSRRSNSQPHTSLHSISTLVVAQPKGHQVGPEALSAVTAAKSLGGGITVLLAGHDLAAASKHASRIQGVSQVLVAEDPQLQWLTAERIGPLLAAVQKKRGFSHIAAGSNSFARNLLPRTAALLDVQPASDVTEIVAADTVVRPIYAGNALQTIKFPADGPCMFTVRASSFPPAAVEDSAVAPVDAVSSEELSACQGEDFASEWVGQDVSTSERPELGSAKVVISGGRALKSADNFQMLYDLADQLKGAVGATRAAVDAGYVPNDMQVGQTGKVVAPDLYIAVGISGAIQHLAGMKDSKCIVAINSDPESPIFQVADYGFVGDLFEAVPALSRQIQSVKAA